MFQGLFFFMNKRYEGMFMETQGLWDVVLKQFGITVLVEFLLVRRHIETFATKTIQ